MHRNDSASKTSSRNFSRQTILYAIAATAAGVSVLALAKPAGAEVVVTKADIAVTSFSGVSLDLNKDGIADFKLFISFYSAGSFFSDKLMVTPLAGGADVGGSSVYASALVRGAKIGPSAHFDTFPEIESSHANVSFNHSTRRFFGKWGVHERNRYLGVRFLIDGKTHYGWIRLTVSTSGPRYLVGTITGYAYETVPNEAILAGSAEPEAEFRVSGDTRSEGKPSLGMLALGTEGLALWRREGANPSQ